MDRAEYNACMAKGLQGKQLSKEERKLEFCTLSKLCSGKASTPEEARKICLETPPKPRNKKARMDPEKLAACVVPKLEVLKLTEHNIHDALSSALAECIGGRRPKKPMEISPKQAEVLRTIQEVMRAYGTTETILGKH